MRLTKKNIAFVREHERNGVPYQYSVAMASGWVSDLRIYRPEEVPPTVKSFMGDKKPVLEYISEYDDGTTFADYAYR